MAVALLPPIWPTSAAYLVGALGALQWPEHRYEFSAVGNLVLVLNAFLVFQRQRKRELAEAKRLHSE